MNPREKKLAIVVGVFAGVAILWKVLYPAVIEPMVDIGDEIAALEDELYDYQEQAESFDRALLDYERLVERTADTDSVRVGNKLQARLDALARTAKLDNPRISVRKARRDRKTGLSRLPIAITAEGSLEQTIRFLQSCYALPCVARFEDLKFAPLGGSKIKRGKPAPDRVKLLATLEVVVLPRDPRAPFDLQNLEQPQELVKYARDSYAMIWDRLPFIAHVAPVKATVKPKTAPPKETKPEPKPEPVKVVSEPKGDQDARYKTVVVAMSYGIDELLVVNERSKTREYVALGTQLDGGELVLVHPYGGVVRKQHGDFFYEVGTKLSEAIPVAIADDYPEIQALSRQMWRGSAKGSTPSGSQADVSTDELVEEAAKPDDPGEEEEPAATDQESGKVATTQPAEVPADRGGSAVDKPSPSKPRLSPPKATRDRSSSRPTTRTVPDPRRSGRDLPKAKRPAPKRTKRPIRGARAGPTTRPQETPK